MNSDAAIWASVGPGLLLGQPQEVVGDRHAASADIATIASARRWKRDVGILESTEQQQSRPLGPCTSS
ncbi:MAG TPA: hypothetical protein VMT69_03305 [Kineosporiaceae bacterium]|nr:hypothetical protein [Kineosporiaceae bacterium]